MGVKTRKEKAKKINKAEIVDAAENLFFSQGYENTTMSELAKEAEFSKRTIYAYFASKEQVFLAIAIRAFKKFIELIEEGLEDNSKQTGWEQIETIGYSFLRLYQNNPDYFKAIANYETKEEDFSSNNVLVQEYYKMGEQAFGFLTAALKEGIEDGSIRADIDLIDTAVVLWGNIMGINQLITNKEKYLKEVHNRSAERIINAVFDFAKRAITK